MHGVPLEERAYSDTRVVGISSYTMIDLLQKLRYRSSLVSEGNAIRTLEITFNTISQFFHLRVSIWAKYSISL